MTNDSITAEFRVEKTGHDTSFRPSKESETLYPVIAGVLNDIIQKIVSIVTIQDTEGSRRYEEITEVKQSGETMEVPAEGLNQHVIGTLHLQQEALHAAFGKLPDHITVTITVHNDS